MHNHEPGEECQHGVPIHFVVLGISFFLVILAAMFLIGMVLGRDVRQVDELDSPAVVTDTSSELVIAWLPIEQRTESPFNSAFRVWYDKRAVENDAGLGTSYTAHNLGTATKNGFSYQLDAETVGVPGMGDDKTTYYILRPWPVDGKPTLLTNYSRQEPSFRAFGSVSPVAWTVAADDEILADDSTVAAFENIGDVNATSVGFASLLGVGDLLSLEQWNVLKQYPVVATLEDGRELRLYDGSVVNDNVALAGAMNELFIVSVEGRVVWYHLDIPFYTPQYEKISSDTAVTWNDGSVVTDSYTPQEAGGCGYKSLTNVVAEPPVLVVAGYATNNRGVVIYEPADFSDQALIDDFTSWKVQHSEGTIEQFGEGHPFFYFKDTLGRYVKLTRTDVLPPGECGKPVIYLYPTTTTDVTVQLAPVGGFTKTEPAYGNGWEVTASPDGSLVNKTDGKTYPYLFWEGRGGLYVEPKYYDVVARSDVPQYLITTLGRLGLNTQETTDFMEFWLPRMQSANYYKIGFHGTSVMNALAPLHLSLVPQTLIRILMDYTELASPIAGNPWPFMSALERKGFTVVEWGGVLR